MVDPKARISFYDQIARNKRKSYVLMAFILLILVALIYIIGLVLSPEYSIVILVFALILAPLYIIFSYYNSHKIALASVNAKPANQTDHRMFHHSVEGLCLASGMPKPKLYVMENSNINAFASGRDPKNSIICVTTGALEKLDKQELEGVIGHELAHIANYDIRYMTLATVLVGMIAIISRIFLRSLWWSSLSGGGRRNSRDNGGQAQVVLMIIGIVFAILAPVFAILVQLSISRKREYAADASAVKFIRSPTGLIGAFKKIKSESINIKDSKKVASAVAPLFISDPFKKNLDSAFSTHPPLSKRIALLDRM
ncbi:M48 family metallopeptidase [Candidatus Pacearchaeota archaeon]|nr:M48 family metallopeptidase [Candidatus Pacearchaeota archaeon]